MDSTLLSRIDLIGSRVFVDVALEWLALILRKVFQYLFERTEVCGHALSVSDTPWANDVTVNV